MEITVGRSPENDIVIDQPVVGRFHLKITYLSDSELIVEDLDTVSFTFINQVRIKKKHLYPSDSLMLGNYQLDTEKLFHDIIKIIRDSRTDYSSEFMHLQTVYSIYEKRVSELKRKSQLLPMIIKSTITIFAIVVAYFAIKDPQIRNLAMTVAGLLGGFITLSVQEDSKVRDEIDILTLKLESEYMCPKCGKSLISRRWQHWAAKKKCDNCNAIWVN